METGQHQIMEGLHRQPKDFGEVGIDAHSFLISSFSLKKKKKNNDDTTVLGDKDSKTRAWKFHLCHCILSTHLCPWQSVNS